MLCCLWRTVCAFRVSLSNGRKGILQWERTYKRHLIWEQQVWHSGTILQTELTSSVLIINFSSLQFNCSSCRYGISVILMSTWKKQCCHIFFHSSLFLIFIRTIHECLMSKYNLSTPGKFPLFPRAIKVCFTNLASPSLDHGSVRFSLVS